MKHAVASGQGQVSSQRSPTALRSAVVSFGPSLLIVGLTAACTFATIRRLVNRSPGRGRTVGQSALGAVAPWVYLFAIRPRVLHWGAHPDEVTRVLPGDELVPQPVWASTRALTIAAPREAVWPWLAQMGQDRAGLYSYERLENLAGLDFHNADRIHPEWQDIAPGDLVRFAPRQDTLMVVLVEPNHALVWRMLDPGTHQTLSPDRAQDGSFVDATWAFVLEPHGLGRTRLIQRFRFDGRPRSLLGLGYTLLIELPHFIMERRMMLGIRSRAEQAWNADAHAM